MSEAPGPSLWDVCVGGLWCFLRRFFFFFLGGGVVVGAAAGTAAPPVGPATGGPDGYDGATAPPVGPASAAAGQASAAETSRMGPRRRSRKATRPHRPPPQPA